MNYFQFEPTFNLKKLKDQKQEMGSKVDNITRVYFTFVVKFSFGGAKSSENAFNVNPI